MYIRNLNTGATKFLRDALVVIDHFNISFNIEDTTPDTSYETVLKCRDVLYHIKHIIEDENDALFRLIDKCNITTEINILECYDLDDVLAEFERNNETNQWRHDC